MTKNAQKITQGRSSGLATIICANIEITNVFHELTLVWSQGSCLNTRLLDQVFETNMMCDSYIWG